MSHIQKSSPRLSAYKLSLFMLSATMLLLTNLACSDDSTPTSDGNDEPTCEPQCAGKCAGAADSCGGVCELYDCQNGCCDANHQCIGVTAQSAYACGLSGGACLSCSDDTRADSCLAGSCVCRATGARCYEGDACSTQRCGLCQPECADKCAGSDDGCGSTCPTNDCRNGCCNAAHQCISYIAQGDNVCGLGGESCLDCRSMVLSCDSTQNQCKGTITREALFISHNVTGIMAPSSTQEVEVTFLNRGRNNWTVADQHKLGSHAPQDNSIWGFNRQALDADDDIAPGQSKTFSFSITAPATPGLYGFQWRMLKEEVEWFGEHSDYIPILVTNGTSTVCEAARSLANIDTDAAATIQGCIDAAAANSIVDLPAGIYRIDQQLVIQTNPIILRTEGKDLTMARCTLTNHGCAEFKASTSFVDEGGILILNSEGSIVDHIVVNGNKTERRETTSGTECVAGNNAFGHNIRITASSCALTGSVTQNTLCGTGCEVNGVKDNIVLWNNQVANNGVHNLSGLWADGVTVHDAANSVFVKNDFLDATDVDLIFGGCQSCNIQQNRFVHSSSFEGSTFAALMLHAWRSTSGDFTDSDTSQNTIDCGVNKRCGFGILLGSDAWYTTDVFGGSVHHNTVNRAQQGFAIDDVYNMHIWDNPVTNSATSTQASCGLESTTAYSKGSRTTNIVTSQDTLGTIYTSKDWDGCIPNWWDQ